MSWKNNISLISLVSHVWDHLAHKVESNMIKNQNVFDVFETPQKMFTYLLCTFVELCDMRKYIYIYMHEDWIDFYMHSCLVTTGL